MKTLLVLCLYPKNHTRKTKIPTGGQHSESQLTTQLSGDGMHQYVAAGRLMNLFTKTILMAVLLPLLSNCIAVDQHGSRITTANHTADMAISEETLLNIVRSSRFQPISFIAISQFAGSQQETFSLGLPTITFGPKQTALQRQFVFSGNSLNSQVQGSFQANPLVTAEFQRGLITPVSQTTLALLLSNYPREVVFYSLIDRARITRNGIGQSFNNDPLDDIPSSQFPICSEHEDDLVDSAFYLKENERVCNYTKFIHQIKTMVDYGITFELLSNTSLPATTAKTADKAPTSLRAQFCYDRTLAKFKDQLKSIDRPCGTGKTFTGDGSLIVRGSKYEFDFVFRSPLGLYRYLGRLISKPLLVTYRFHSEELWGLRGEKFPNIIIDDGSKCGVRVDEYDIQWCIPTVGSSATFMAFSILQNLRNLSISPNDLNSAFAVRVVN